MKTPLLPDFTADWRDMTFIHYRFSPADLRPVAAFPLDPFAGDAYVSLVLFRLERMQLAGWGAVGRLACRPISNHFFLNLRTYVRMPAGPGIQFLAEWIPNPLSLWLGPRVYGLPYRRGVLREQTGRGGGERAWTITDPDCANRLEIATGPAVGEEIPCQVGSLEEHLFERYLAFTERRGVQRSFTVEHAPWTLRRPQWVRCLTDLVERAFPWFRSGELVGSHETAGLQAVRMTRPTRLNPREPAFQRSRHSRNAFFSALD